MKQLCRPKTASPRVVRSGARVSRFGLGLLTAALLAACIGGQEPSSPDHAPNPITLDSIEVSALPSAGAVATPPAPSEGAPSDPAAPLDASKEEAPKPAGALTPEPEAQAPLAAPAAPKSEMQLACEKRSGIWSKTPNGLYACVSRTRDGGKICAKAGDCSGQCLARSGTCTPMVPLFGCHEVFDDLGRRMTQCLN